MSPSAAASQIVSSNPYYVERLAIAGVPSPVELGIPFDLPVDIGGNGFPELQIFQHSEKGGPTALPGRVSRAGARNVLINVTPLFYGDSRFRVAATYPDGGVAFKEVAATVNLPSDAPSEFHASFPISVVKLESDNPSTRLSPWAVYANIPGLYQDVSGLDKKVARQIQLDAGYVSYSIAAAAEPAVVRLDPANGIVYGLRPGTATIIGRFGQFVDKVLVVVKGAN